MTQNVNGGHSELLLVRLLTVGIALIAGIKILYFFPAMSVEMPHGFAVPFFAGVFGEFGIPVFAGCAAFGVGLRALRRLNGLSVLGHVLAVVLMVIQSAVTGIPSIQPWLLLAGGSLMAAIIFFGPSLGSLLGALIAYAIVEFPRADTAPAYDFLRVTFDVQIATAAVLGGLVAVTLHVGRRLDDVAAESAALMRDSAKARARAEVSTVAARITHDNILSTLLFGAANNPLFRDAVAAQAERALKEIDRLTASAASEEPWPLRDFWQRVVETVAKLDSHALIQGPPVHVGSIPSSVAEAVLSAVTEALKNSVAHAYAPGMDGRRCVTLAGADSAFEVRIEDSGVGFDVMHVPSSRRGIKTSIIGRMAAIPGGNAVVESQPGLGTTVRITWNLHDSKTTPVNSSPARSEGTAANALSLRLAWIGAGIFILSQGAMFLFSSINGGDSVVSFVAFIALTIPVITLARNRFLPRPDSTLMILAGVGIASGMVFFQTFTGPVLRQDFWFLTSCAFLLLWLLRIDRAWWAWAGMTTVAAMTVASAVSQGASAAAGIDLVIRPAAILLVGTFCAIAVRRLQLQISSERANTARLLEQESYSDAIVSQRQAEASRLRQQAGALLEVLSEGRELTRAQAQECAALEGTLRDEVVGGRLSRPDISDAASHARRLGVDVALIDDGLGVSISDAEMNRVEQWMTTHLAEVTSGRFVGRIPPEGSDVVATIVITDVDGPRRLSLQSEPPLSVARFTDRTPRP